MQNGELIQKQYSNSHIAFLQGELFQTLDFGTRSGYRDPIVKENLVVARNDTPKKSKQVTVLTKKQFNQFLSVIENPSDRIIYLLMYWAGLRIGEALALTVDDYDFSTKEINVNKNYDSVNKVLTNPKTRVTRLVRLPKSSRIEVESFINEIKGNVNYGQTFFSGLNKPLPRTTHDGRRRRYYNKMLQESDKNNVAPVPYFENHELRHSHVSILISLGLSSFEISKRMGHSVREVEERYGH